MELKDINLARDKQENTSTVSHRRPLSRYLLELRVIGFLYLTWH